MDLPPYQQSPYYSNAPIPQTRHVFPERSSSSYRSPRKTTVYIIIGVLVFLILMACMCSYISSTVTHETSSGSTSARKSQSTSISATATQEVIKQKKDEYISFYRRFMTIANKSDTLDKKVLNDLKSVAKGNMSAVDLYLSASDATDQQDELRQEADNLEIPENLNDYSDTLQSARDDLSNLIYSRSEAMKNVMDYVDSGDLSKLVDLRNNIKDQNSSMIDAVSNLISVSMKLKVNTSKIHVK